MSHGWRFGGWCLVFCGALARPATAQTSNSIPANSWTNPASGSWQDLSWSLGTLPTASQAVFITNSGWKAVQISSVTASNFSASLHPMSVEVDSPTNSKNMLLLNYAGFQSPLAVQQLTVGTNAGLTALSSALQVSSGLSLGGELNQGDFASVSIGTLKIGDIGPGIYNLTNGSVLITGSAQIGGAFSGRFNQFGGTNYADSIQLLPQGEYDIYDGALITADIAYRTSSGNPNGVVQKGGLVKPDALHVARSSYVLACGFFVCSNVFLPGVISQFDYAESAGFVQTGGTNQSSSILIGTFRPPFANASAFGNYTLSNGVLNASTIVVGPYGSFNQSGGKQTTASITLSGDDVYFGYPGYAAFALSGGTMQAGNISMTLANFTQSGGTNQIAGSLSLGTSGFFGSSYLLAGGLLSATNATISCSSYSDSGFTQSGGTHVVSNLLAISQGLPPSMPPTISRGYSLTGGQLISPNIRVESFASFIHAGGTLVNSESLALAAGTWHANVGEQILGRIFLGISGGSNSVLALPAGPTVLRFANSSGAAWSQGATLAISGWNGSISGGGRHQVYFGNDATGLIPAQLAQVFFVAPRNVPGMYPALLLATGEIVPAQLLVGERTDTGLTLSWPYGFVLQTATAVLGPYQDVPSETGSYHIDFTEPRRFFRIRSASASAALVSAP